MPRLQPLLICVWERQIYKAIEISGRQKHRPLNSYISLSEENSPLKDTEDTKQQNPEEIIIDRENADLMLERIRKKTQSVGESGPGALSGGTGLPSDRPADGKISKIH